MSQAVQAQGGKIPDFQLPPAPPLAADKLSNPEPGPLNASRDEVPRQIVQLNYLPRRPLTSPSLSLLVAVVALEVLQAWRLGKNLAKSPKVYTCLTCCLSERWVFVFVVGVIVVVDVVVVVVGGGVVVVVLLLFAFLWWLWLLFVLFLFLFVLLSLLL